MAKRAHDEKGLSPSDGQDLAGMQEFLGRFGMDLEATPANVRMVTEQVEMIGRMIDAMNSVGLVERGKRMIWLKASVGHGQWLPLLDRLRVPARTAQWWMAEARYAMEHQMRKPAHLISAGGGAFDEDEGDELDADDLADPRKKAPKPRKELENEVSRLKRRLEAREKREARLQDQIDELAERLARAAKARDPDEVTDDAPCRSALAKAVLTLGRTEVFLWREVDPAVLIDEMASGPVLLNLLMRIDAARDRIAERLRMAFAEAHPAKPWPATGPILSERLDDEEAKRGL